MTSEQAQQLVAVLAAAFPGTLARLDADQQRVMHGTYRRMLVDLDYAATNAAIERLLATAKFLPTVAEIREATLAVVEGPRSNGGEAWGAVLRAIRKWGVYRVPGVDFTFADPVTARAVSDLNWTELCNSENAVADRARFIELYDQLAREHRTKKLSEHLPAMQRYRAIESEKRSQLKGETIAETILRLVPAEEPT